MISAQTELYAVFGHPIGHSLSPTMHNAAFDALDMDALYLALDVVPSRLMGTLSVMAELGFRGINLTVPLKEEAYKEISKLGESARLLGSVNTVKITSGTMEGHSTDGDGFLRGVREAFGLDVKGLSVFVIGCGGAGRAVALASAMAGADKLVLADLDSARAVKLASDISGIKDSLQAVVEPCDSWHRAAHESDLVVHATPVGMRDDERPLLEADAFRPGQYVYDLIYMFPETALMKEARKAGAAAANGLGMLLFQGASSFSIWTGRDAPVGAMRDALVKAVYGEEGV